MPKPSSKRSAPGTKHVQLRSDAGAFLAVGSLAAGSIGLGLIVAGGVDLPPLPAVNVGAVCNLPQEAIDFLKDNGSMERHECEPEEQPAP